MTKTTRFLLILIQVLVLYVILMFLTQTIDGAEFKLFYLSLSDTPKTTSFFFLGSALTVINTFVFLKKK